MDVVRIGSGEEKQGEFTCQHCKSIFRATKAEFGECHPDDRDGAYYNVNCPVCSKKLFISARLVDARTNI